MFVFNVKFSKSKIAKILIIIFSFIAITILIISSIKLFKEMLNSKTNNLVLDTVENDIAILNSRNYTNVLKEVHENLDTYIGQKISFTGYVYKINNISDNQFILARDMIINNKNQTVVVGFLCRYDDSLNLQPNTWVNITGIIEKGNYNGEIPIINIETLSIVQKPADELVYPPDDNYVPTAVIF